MKKIVLVCLSFFFVSMLFFIPRSEKETSKDFQIKGSSFFEGLKILQKKDSNVVWTLLAKRADFIEDENIVKLSDITMTVQKNGVVFYADKGAYNLSNKNFTAEGPIKAKSTDYTIIADSIDYDDSSGNFKTEGSIAVEGKRFKVDGKGMEVDSEQKVRILKDVKATFYK
ncbi:MAG: hypothetical protein FJ242_01165 [Nitrospira sp.]|nr:hypothetical protein [Nitrospira sp.]